MPRPVGGAPPRVPTSARTDATRDATPAGGAHGPAPAAPLDGMDAPRPSAAGGADRGRVAARRGSPGFEPVELLPGVTVSGASGFRVDGRRSDTDGGVTQTTTRVLYEVASRLANADENPFTKLTTAQRKAVLEHLTPFLLHASEFRGRPSALSVRSRAASWALLVRLAGAMATSGEQSRARSLVDRLLDAARGEKDPGLRVQMRLGLEALPKKLLTAGQIRARRELQASVSPPEPPYEKWFARENPPTFKVFQNVQDEFWIREVANYRKEGFTIEVKNDEKGHRHVIASKVLKDPAGKAPDTHARVELVEKDEDVFAAMDDKSVDAVFYTGHSGVGAVAQWSLERAPEQRGDKLIGLFACRTKQNLNMVRRQFPDAHLLASNHGTYGNDDRIVIASLFDMVARRGTYASLRKEVESSDIWEADNYFYPHDKRQLEHIDLDGDGRTARSGGRTDLLYDVEVKRGAGERITFKPARRVKDPATLDGSRVVDSVGWFNSLYSYWADDFGSSKEKARRDRFSADGWFQSDDPNEIVRVSKVDNPGAAPVWRVQVNAAYADQSRDALAMLVTWGMNETLSKELRPTEGEYDRRLRGLGFISSYLGNLVEYSDIGDLLLSSFARRFGFPPSLSYDTVWSAVMSDHDHEASPKILARLEKGMQYPFLEVNPNRTSLAFRTYVQKALDELKKSDAPIARMTFEAIVTGKVQIDDLTDLTRSDYLRMVKEFKKDGIQLDKNGWGTLGDPRSGTMRAITNEVDGYMWDDRVYVSPGRKPRDLAATLVHEVNHILNRSEEHYRTDAAIFLEEYRAYYAEALFREEPVDDPAFCLRLKERVIEDYGLDGVTPDLLPDEPPGVFLAGPDASWGRGRARPA